MCRRRSAKREPGTRPSRVPVWSMMGVQFKRIVNLRSVAAWTRPCILVDRVEKPTDNIRAGCFLTGWAMLILRKLVGSALALARLSTPLQAPGVSWLLRDVVPGPAEGRTVGFVVIRTSSAAARRQ